MEFYKIKVIRGELPDWIGIVVSGDGYGYGSGYGSGDGYGYGSGDGYGYGYGDGSGDGYGYGSGDGYGYGSGDGYGYGSGDGYGDGDGYGSGDGDGKEKPNYNLLFNEQQNGWSEAIRSRLQEIWRDCSALAFWKSDERGLPSNGGDRSITPAAPGVVHELSGTLKICSNGLHATIDPDKWQGDRLWVVALCGEVQWQDDKCAALKREIIAEIQL